MDSRAVSRLRTRWGAHVRFLVVYVQEAHTTDGWRLGRVLTTVPQHKTLDDRLAAARAFVERFSFEIETCVDSMANHFNNRFAVWPERLVVLRRPSAGAAPVLAHIQRTDARGGGALWTDEAEAWLQQEFPVTKGAATTTTSE